MGGCCGLVLAVLVGVVLVVELVGVLMTTTKIFLASTGIRLHSDLKYQRHSFFFNGKEKLTQNAVTAVPK